MLERDEWIIAARVMEPWLKERLEAVDREAMNLWRQGKFNGEAQTRLAAERRAYQRIAGELQLQAKGK